MTYIVVKKIKNKKSIAFLYTNNDLFEREIKKTIPFTITLKKSKLSNDKSKQGGRRPIH